MSLFITFFIFSSFFAHTLLADAKTYQLSRNLPGFSPIIFYYDQPHQVSTYPVILFLQGSECRSVESRPGLSPKSSIMYKTGFLLIEKPGISSLQNSDKDEQNCTPEFRQRNTLNQRLFDAMAVIQYLKKMDPRWNRQLFIIGGSEGGMLAPILAGLVPETKKVAMMVAGNGRLMAEDTREALILTARAQGLSPIQITQLSNLYDLTIKDIKANPHSLKMYLGHTYKWWASVLWVNPLAPMLKLDKPMLLVHGTEDTSVPVISARIAAGVFQQMKKTNLTYWELPGLNHGLTDKNGTSHKADVLNKSLLWLLN